VIARNPFVAWTVVGVLIGLTIAAPGLALIAIPLAIAGIVLVSRRSREPDDALGIVAGAGLGFLAAGWVVPGVIAVALGVGAHAMIGRLAARR
jgi:uncharacterized protein YqgC (DUF456 family)